MEAIGDDIAHDNPAAAERWVLQLMAIAETAGRNPLAERWVPELSRDDVREVFRRTSRIVYRVLGKRSRLLLGS